MQSFDVAHIREQGVDLIIVFVSDTVRWMSDEERNQILTALTLCAHSADLAGYVVLVWPGGFFCRKEFHAFFESAPYDILSANINKKLTCENL